jgi:hypothetical protein
MEMEVEPALHEFGWIAFEVAPFIGVLVAVIRARVDKSRRA